MCVRVVILNVFDVFGLLPTKECPSLNGSTRTKSLAIAVANVLAI